MVRKKKKVTFFPPSIPLAVILSEVSHPYWLNAGKIHISSCLLCTCPIITLLHMVYSLWLSIYVPSQLLFTMVPKRHLSSRYFHQTRCILYTGMGYNMKSSPDDVVKVKKAMLDSILYLDTYPATARKFFHISKYI